jgi:cytochrome c
MPVTGEWVVRKGLPMKFTTFMITAAMLAGASVAHADGNAKDGATVFKKCAACHTATEAKNKVGPSLMGVVGRPIASVAGFKYSDPMKAFGEGGKVWDEATLTTYLADPKKSVPKTKMAFAGLKKPEDIANVITYLKDPAAAK